MNGKYISNRLSEPKRFYEHKSDRFNECGLELEFTTGHLKAINLGFSFTDLDWSPDDFFEQIEGTDLTRKYYSYNFMISYKIPLT